MTCTDHTNSLAILIAAFTLTAAGVAAPVCATCHPKETARYLETGMGNSLLPAAPIAGGQIFHKRSESRIDVSVRDGRMVQRLSEAGLTAEYPMAYQIGSGKAGRGYIAHIGDYLIQSPAGWYNGQGWDVAPGFVASRFLDFDRVIDDDCLYCHANAAQFDESGRRFTGSALTAISCERCHGPSAEHVKHPSAKNIVNPARLNASARDSICEQCHLEGAARILNPGRNLQDYRPGDDLARTFVIYLRERNGESVKAVSQAEQLAESRCVQKSGGKLWCGSCHNPHSGRADRNREVREVCVSCHAKLSPAAHPKGPWECVSCHMPGVSPEDILHAAITDHRILRYRGEGRIEQPNNKDTLSTSGEPPARFRKRDLGLAELKVGAQDGIPAMAEAGMRLLESLPDLEKQNDPAVLAALATAKLQTGMASEALALIREAAEKQPRNASYAFYLALALGKANEIAAAERQFRRAIELDPSRKEFFIELCTLYIRQGRAGDLAETIDRYLSWNPNSIGFRFQRARLLPPEPEK